MAAAGKSALARTVTTSASHSRIRVENDGSTSHRRADPVIVNIGPVGIVIRSTIRKIVPELPMFTAHRITRQILVDLHSLGILKGDPASGTKLPSSRLSAAFRNEASCGIPNSACTATSLGAG